jgi:hypothetical protein
MTIFCAALLTHRSPFLAHGGLAIPSTVERMRHQGSSCTMILPVGAASSRDHRPHRGWKPQVSHMARANRQSMTVELITRPAGQRWFEVKPGRCCSNRTAVQSETLQM